MGMITSQPLSFGIHYDCISTSAVTLKVMESLSWKSEFRAGFRVQPCLFVLVLHCWAPACRTRLIMHLPLPDFCLKTKVWKGWTFSNWQESRVRVFIIPSVCRIKAFLVLNEFLENLENPTLKVFQCGCNSRGYMVYNSPQLCLQEVYVHMWDTAMCFILVQCSKNTQEENIWVNCKIWADVMF